MKHLVLFIFMFIVFSCKKEVNYIDNKISNLISKSSNSVKPQVFSKIKAFKLNDNKTIQLDIVFNKNSIVEPLHQKIYLSYLFSKTKELHNYESIIFNYNIEEEDFNLNSFSLDGNEKSEVIKKFENETFDKLIRYCLSNFNEGTIFCLNTWIKNINLAYPNELINRNFFEILEQFSQECFSNSQIKDAKSTIVVLYVAIKDYVVKSNSEKNTLLEDHEISQKALEDLWQICTDGEMIEFAEHRLYGKVGNNWINNK